MQKRPSNRSCRPVNDRRRSHRLLCSDLIRIYWKEENGGPQEVVAVLEDYSQAGASLFVGVPIPVGVRATLRSSREKIAVSVRYCVQAPNGYLTGISFEQAAPDFLPSHTLNPDRLEFDD